MTKKVAVVGAGIAGITAAYYLAKEGYQVDVYDQERYPAMKTSYANGGQISVSNSETWTTWPNIQKGFKWMLRKDAPLLFRPKLDWDQWAWMAKFLYHTAKGSYEANTRKTIQMGLESKSLYDQIVDQERLQFDQAKCGILHIYKNQKYLDAAIAAGEIYRSEGVQWDIFGPQQTRSVDAALAHMEGIVGSAWTASDSVGDIHKFCVELAKVLRNKYNVNFYYNSIVDNLGDLGYFDKVVIANGVGSRKLAKTIGDNIPVYPVKGYSITIQTPNRNFNTIPKVSLLDDETKIVCSLLGDRLRVAGTAEFDGENYDIRRDRIEPLLRWVEQNFPHISTKDYSSWCCLRPMTPNMMPIVKRSESNPSVFYHTGHGHLGWTLSPATAKQLVELIKNDR